MGEFKLFGSGGSIIADLTDAQAKTADLGVGKLFLAPIGKVELSKIKGYSCNACKADFGKPPNIKVEREDDDDDGATTAAGPEQVSENLMLVERGQYTCDKCGSVIGNYRVFVKGDKDSDAGLAKPSSL